MRSGSLLRGKNRARGKRLRTALLMGLLLQSGLQARLRFIGPNPYYSFLTYPQDSRQFALNSSFSFFYLRARGWMGHLDIPELSPSPTYVNTEESVEENIPSGQTAQAGFKGNWISPEIMTATYVFEFKSVRIIPLVSGKLDSFSLRSSGLAIPYENPGAVIPFSSDLSQRNEEFSLGLLTAASIRRVPVGILLNYRRYREGSPEGTLSFSKDGQDVRLNRFNWGWSTVQGCNHIFGSKTNIDAFWEDSYTSTKGSQFDVVLGADIGENKLGFRFRQLMEYGDEYGFSSAENRYLKDPYRLKAAKTFLRTSELFKITDIQEAKLFLCAVAEADFLRQNYLAGGTDLLDSYKENAYALELLPILHFDLDRGGFFRIATSASFFWKDYGYRDVWGDQEVYSPGWAHIGWETSWERSSYGHTFTFINFTEADLELPLVERWGFLMSLDVWSHQVFAWTKRYYGDNVKNAESYDFAKEAERKNALRESWFGGTFGLMAGKRISLGLFLDLPVYYDKNISTEIAGMGEMFKGRSDAQPAIRKPVSLWALLVWRW